MNFHKIWEQKQSIKHPVSVVAEVTLFANTTLKRTPLKHLKTKDAITLHKRFVVLWNSRHLRSQVLTAAAAVFTNLFSVFDVDGGFDSLTVFQLIM